MNNKKKALEVEQNDISFSKATDYFIYSRFSEKGISLINGEQIRYAENLSDAVLYIHYILLYDILNDLLDDMEYDFKTLFSKKQLDIIAVMNFWFRFGKIHTESEKQILQLCKEFNNQFTKNDDLQYEIHIINGLEKLKKFLTDKYEKSTGFDEFKLESICSKEEFCGEELKAFIEKLFNS